jgi:osmotically-inducible protein OsmY
MAGLLAGCLPAWTTPAQLMGDAAVAAAEERALQDVTSDFSAKAEILQEFATKGQSLLASVRIDVYEGDVLLTGIVTEQDDEKKAEALTKGVEGIQNIFNEIQVSTDGGLENTAIDLTIEYKVQAALLGRIHARIINYRWRCVNRTVYLIGLAKDKDELDEALDAVIGTDGVEDVVHHIRIKGNEKTKAGKAG